LYVQNTPLVAFS